MEYTISEENFLNWYYEDNMDETIRLKENLANAVIQQLLNNGVCNITVQNIFESCNINAIKVCYIDGFDNDDDDKEFGDLEGNNTIKLK